ncbi:MAG: succinate dehydrogenase cytochrome b subunit [Thermodesulfobacteriota bacterium]|nr:succinate dehydrogenase cytochrome b subunit [Thermodesulfobacteriota bacterium]
MATWSRVVMSSVGKKGVMAASGIMLSFFLLVHALGNSSTFLGREAFNSYARHLHSLGWLIPLFEVGLVVVFLTHIVLGCMTWWQNKRARPHNYEVYRSSGGRSAGSKTMPYTGLIILAFLLVHLQNFHFIDHSREISAIVKGVLVQPRYVIFYSIAMLALALHMSHGFWSMFQSLGINHPKYNLILHRGTLFLCMVIAAVFVLIPVLGLLWPNFLL